MFVYERNGKLNITFTDNKPVDFPEITFDATANKLSVNDVEVPAIEADILTEDVVYPTAQKIDTAKTVVLNGNKISIPEDTNGDGVYHVVAGGYLTIDGDGIVDGVGKNDYNMAVWSDGGHVVINGGHFTNKGATAKVDPAHFDLIYAKNGGVVEINGGYFECETPKWTLNNNNTNPGKIIVKGGTFVGFNPAEAYTDDEGANNPVNYVAEGYKVVVDGNNYTVIKK